MGLIYGDRAVNDKYSERNPEEEIMKAFQVRPSPPLPSPRPPSDWSHYTQLFDDDRTGRINIRNMKRVARELGENLNEDELQAMIDEFDRDQDGEISGDEFMWVLCAVNCRIIADWVCVVGT